MSSDQPIISDRTSNDAIAQLSHYSGVHSDITPMDSASHTPPNKQHVSETRVMTSRFPEKNMMRIIGCYLWAFSGGFSDAAPGALLPTMEDHYHISYAVVSLIWMSNAAGFILVAIFSHKIHPLFGLSKSVPLGCFCSLLMYAIVSSGGPFPLIVASFFIGGVGWAIVLAQLTIFLSKLDKSSKYLSFFHGGYGLGATVSPFVATTMTEHGVPWNYTYLVNMTWMFSSLFFLFYAFREADTDLKPWEHTEESERLCHTEQATRVPSGVNMPVQEQSIGMQHLAAEEVAHKLNQNEWRGAGSASPSPLGTALPESEPSSSTSAAHASGSTPYSDFHAGTSDAGFSAHEHAPRQSNMRLALSNKLTWMIAFYLLCYQGTEVALGGWIVSYLVDYRHTSASYGYVSSGFWGGLTIGRIFITWPLDKYFGAKRSVTMLAYLTILLLVLTWVIPNDIISGVFVSLAGLSIGPVYPLLVTTVSKMLPREIQIVSITIMSAFGSSGGAIIPFVVGLISQKAGTFVVLPVSICTYSMVLILWFFLHMAGSQEQYSHFRKRLLAALW